MRTTTARLQLAVTAVILFFAPLMFESQASQDSGIRSLAPGYENRYFMAQAMSDTRDIGTGDRVSKDYYLVCAHYDGQGLDGEGRYFPSANDKASGIAALVGTARRLQPLASRMNFSILFAAVTGEEIGMQGSNYFCRKPPIPLAQICGVINLDMVGTGSGKKMCVQMRDENNNLFLSAKQVAKRMGIRLEPYVRVHLGSDAYIFAEHELCSVFFLTGDENNHTKKDTAGNINAAAMNSAAELVARILTSRNSSPDSW